MARAAKPKKEISMEEALWKSADKLRGSVEPAEYKHVVLSLFFLKFASDKFEECRNKIIATHGEKYADMKTFYTQENVFYLPEESRWKYIIENAKQDDIALKIDTALYTIEKNNPALKGALPDNYYSRLHIDTAKLASLLDEIVYFDARTKIHLQNYLNSRKDDNPALFVSLQSPYNRMNIGGIEVRLRQLGKRLGLNKVHPHKFRRTLATMAIDKGMPIEQLQQLLGHRRIDTTLQYAMVKQSNVKIAHRKYIG